MRFADYFFLPAVRFADFTPFLLAETFLVAFFLAETDLAEAAFEPVTLVLFLAAFLVAFFFAFLEDFFAAFVLFFLLDLPNAADQPSAYFSLVPTRRIVMIFS